uniref:Vacuolar protein sorting-associated protein 68 n=1 Tax=Anthurium amnicola TaxID=1678845 RepID=A0A1D1XRR7_9ARAE
MVHRLLSSTPPTLSPIYTEYENRRICYRFPQTKVIAIYLSGGLFAIGWWAFIDALIYTRLNRGSLIFNAGEVITGVITTLGMLLVALIDKSIFSDEAYYTSRRTLWKARLFLFFGFTLMVSSLIGSVAFFVYHLLSNHYYGDVHRYYFGISIVVQNGCILMSSLILLIGQYSNNEAKYDFL